MTERRYQCPQCGHDDRLWEGIMVSAWRGLDSTLKPTHEKEADWCHVEPDMEIGCGQCDWHGLRGDLVPVGSDGQPLEEPIPGQLELS